MRLGLIARADRSGLGTQTHEFYRHMHPDKVLVIDVGHLHNNTIHCNKSTDLTRYPGAMVCSDWSPNSHMITQFLRGLDVVFSAECWYSNDLVQLAPKMGVKTVLQPNWEMFPLWQPMPDLLAAPSMWHYEDLPDPKRFLPVPIAMDRFEDYADRAVYQTATRFLHAVGRPAIHDRNGSLDLLKALQYVTADITVTVKSQDAAYMPSMIRQHNIHTPNNVTLVLDSADVPNYWDAYRDQDVLILPRKYGGLSLPVHEALGAGLPVVMPNISPNTWLPDKWLVPANQGCSCCGQNSFMAHNQIALHTVDHKALADTIDRFASSPQFYADARVEACKLAGELSWASQLDVYKKVLNGL